MALPSSGTISLQAIATEFGGSAPHAISEYYRGGGLVPNTSVNAGIPTSGQIAFSNFYGGSATSPITYAGGSAQSSGTSTTVNVLIPSSGVAGDMAIVCAYRRSGSSSPTIPPGFTNLQSGGGGTQGITTAFRYITASDPGTTYPFSSGDRLSAVCALYRNVQNIQNPLLVSGSGVPTISNFAPSIGINRTAIYCLGFKGGFLSTDWNSYLPIITSLGQAVVWRAGAWNINAPGDGSSAGIYDSLPTVAISNGQNMSATPSTWPLNNDWLSVGFFLIQFP